MANRKRKPAGTSMVIVALAAAVGGGSIGSVSLASPSPQDPGESNLTIDTPVTISGTFPNNPSTSCVREFEAVPEIPLSGSVKAFASFGQNSSNWTAPAWNNWQASKQTIPVAAGVTAGFDAGAAQRGDILYASVIGAAAGGTHCIAVAATTSTLLSSGTWEFPLTCLAAADTSTDGPVIDVDHGGLSFWAVEREGSQIKLTIAPNCGYGQPGGPACPTITPVTMPLNEISGGHATVSVNPCTGNGVVAYWDAFNNVRLNIRRPDGTQVKDYALAMNIIHSGNTGCTNGQVRLCSTCNCLGEGCSPGTPCSRSVPKPQVVVDNQAGTCYAYVTFDVSKVANDGKNYYKSQLFIVNLGTASNPKETSPTITKTWQSTINDFAWNDWQPTLSISLTDGDIGWFKYSDILGPCNTIFNGFTDTASGFANLTATGNFSGQFPNARFSDSGGIGDYVFGVRKSFDGYVYPSWTQPIPTSSTNTLCNLCGTQRYSKVIKLARVSP